MQHLNSSGSAVFLVPGSTQRVVLSPEVIQTMTAYTQTEHTQPEAGGQLFGRLLNGDIMVCRATTPRSADQRTRFSFFPNRNRENREIKRFFKLGLHFLGDWHSHPEPVPKPSALDIQSIQDCFRESKHSHNSFLLLIVGTEFSPDKIWLSQHNGVSSNRLMFQSCQSD